VVEIAVNVKIGVVENTVVVEVTSELETGSVEDGSKELSVSKGGIDHSHSTHGGISRKPAIQEISITVKREACGEDLGINGNAW